MTLHTSERSWKRPTLVALVAYLVGPEDGRLPFTEKGAELAARIEARDSHEGNYSLPNILQGGQAEAARVAESELHRHR